MQIGGRGIFSARSINVHPVLAGQPQIGDEHIDLFALEHIHRAGDVGRDIDIELILEQATHPVAGVLLVIDDEDGGLRHGAERSLDSARSAMYAFFWSR